MCLKSVCVNAHFVAHDCMRSTNSQDLVNQLGWASLESRRLLAQVSLFYKIKNNLIDLEFPSSIQPAPRSMIQHAMLQPYSSVLAHSYSPFVRTGGVWNKLSTQTVQAKNITSFKSLAMSDIQNMKTPNHLKRLWTISFTVSFWLFIFIVDYCYLIRYFISPSVSLAIWECKFQVPSSKWVNVNWNSSK